MAEALMKLYETMPATAQKELYDFALFLLSQNNEQSCSAFDEPLDDFAEYM